MTASMPVLSAVAAQWADRPPEETLHTAALADELGYPELWIGEHATYDAFSLATAIGLATDRIPLTIGPLAVGVRDPALIAMGAASVAALTRRPVRVALGTGRPAATVSRSAGTGPGSAASRSTGSGPGAAGPLSITVRTVRALLAGDPAPSTAAAGAEADGAEADGAGRAGGAGKAGKAKGAGRAGGKAAKGARGSGAGNDAGRADDDGFRLRLDAPGGDVTVAALGPEAVRVAAEHADRMVVDMVSVEVAARLRADLDQAAKKAERPSPRLAAWLPTAVDPAPEALAQLVRALVPHLGLPGYREIFTEAGYAEVTELAASGAAYQDVVRALPLEILNTTGLVGDRTTIATRIAEYAEAGVDEIAIVPATASDRGGASTLTSLHDLKP